MRVATKEANRNTPKGSANENGQDPATPKKARSLASFVLLSNTPGLSDGPLKNGATGKNTGDKPPAAPRRPNTKKARQAAEFLKRHEYAQQLFDDLNKSVFKGGLPNNTQLNWNKRLLTTAGRAKYHRCVLTFCQSSINRSLTPQRSREGIVTAEIEMAEKILDCEGEMPHFILFEY